MHRRPRDQDELRGEEGVVHQDVVPGALMRLWARQEDDVKDALAGRGGDDQAEPNVLQAQPYERCDGAADEIHQREGDGRALD